MRRVKFAILIGFLLLAITPVIQGQSLPPGAGGTTLSGWLNVIVGDPLPGTGGEGKHFIVLQDGEGTIIAELLMDENTARELSGQRVVVIGNPDSPQGGQSIAPLVIIPQSVQALPVEPGDLSAPAELLSGSQPWVNIICRFPNIAGTPHPATWYDDLFGNVYPGLDHYWRQVSYNNIDLDGTITMPNAYVLPHSRSHYVYDTAQGEVVELEELAQDCTAAANADVYFPHFVGINLMLNGSLGCCAWGGGTPLDLDGQERVYLTTWLPPNGQNFGTIAHEMGHGFGFPHSSGPSWDPPSELQIYVSAWDVMSVSSGTCSSADPEYGCLAPGTIAYHLDMDGWIPSSQRETVIIGEDQTITLEQIGLPQSSSNDLLAKVLIGNSALRFYTVEARRFTGYDQNVPGQAVIIHEVDTQREGNAGHALIVDNDANYDVNDAGARWLPGETFTDATNNISIQIISAGATSFTVRIINNSTQVANPDPPTNMRTTGGAGSITLEWDDNSFNEDGFRIYHFTNAGFVLLDTVGANVTSYTQSGLDCDVARYYQVAAYKSAFETERDDFTWVMGVSNPCVPSLNTPANGANLSASEVTLRWFAASGAERYEVRLGTSSPAPTVASNVAGTSYIASNLVAGTYYWQVRAVNSLGGASAWSSQRTFTIASPIGIAPDRNFSDTATLTWNRLSWATGYHVQVARDAGFNDVVYDKDDLTEAQFSATPPLEDGTYYWRVRAFENGTPRAWSAPEQFSVG